MLQPNTIEKAAAPHPPERPSGESRFHPHQAATRHTKHGSYGVGRPGGQSGFLAPPISWEATPPLWSVLSVICAPATPSRAGISRSLTGPWNSHSDPEITRRPLAFDVSGDWEGKLNLYPNPPVMRHCSPPPSCLSSGRETATTKGLGKTHTFIRRRQWHPTLVLLPGKSHGRGSLVGCSPWGHEESDTTERLHFHFSLSCIGEGNGNPLQCSCLENPRDGGAWWAAVYGAAQCQTWLKRLSSSSSNTLNNIQNAQVSIENHL